MPLTIQTRKEDPYLVIGLSGALTLGPGLQALQAEVRKALDGSTPKGLLLDVSEVSVVDSAGLGELTVIYSVASRKGCPLVLVGVTPHIRHILEVTRLDALLPSSPDFASAKKTMKGGTEAR